MLSVLQSGVSLSLLGSLDIPMDEIVQQASAFIGACYGYPGETNMTSVRLKVWARKMGNKKLNLAHDLKVLHPTAEVFEYHVYHTHLQAAIWKSYKAMDPPVLNPEHYGWKYDDDEEIMVPIALPVDVDEAPVEVLKMIKCGCSTCSTARCSCRQAGLSCSPFCKCRYDHECKNPHTKHIHGPVTDEEEEDDEI